MQTLLGSIGSHINRGHVKNAKKENDTERRSLSFEVMLTHIQQSIDWIQVSAARRHLVEGGIIMVRLERQDTL